MKRSRPGRGGSVGFAWSAGGAGSGYGAVGIPAADRAASFWAVVR